MTTHVMLQCDNCEHVLFHVIGYTEDEVRETALKYHGWELRDGYDWPMLWCPRCRYEDLPGEKDRQVLAKRLVESEAKVLKLKRQLSQIKEAMKS